MIKININFKEPVLSDKKMCERKLATVYPLENPFGSKASSTTTCIQSLSRLNNRNKVILSDSDSNSEEDTLKKKIVYAGDHQVDYSGSERDGREERQKNIESEVERATFGRRAEHGS